MTVAFKAYSQLLKNFVIHDYLFSVRQCVRSHSQIAMPARRSHLNLANLEVYTLFLVAISFYKQRRTKRILNLACTEVSKVYCGQFYMTGLIILLEVRCTFQATYFY